MRTVEYVHATSPFDFSPSCRGMTKIVRRIPLPVMDKGGYCCHGFDVSSIGGGSWRSLSALVLDGAEGNAGLKSRTSVHRNRLGCGEKARCCMPHEFSPLVLHQAKIDKSSSFRNISCCNRSKALSPSPYSSGMLTSKIPIKEYAMSSVLVVWRRAAQRIRSAIEHDRSHARIWP